ncbi:MAG: hypothetical protein PHR49_05225, partial [Methanoculleus sp.]|nr:hypothetical protein [Methanoculleus sp.]
LLPGKREVGSDQDVNPRGEIRPDPLKDLGVFLVCSVVLPDVVQSYVIHALGMVRERIENLERLPGKMEIIADHSQCH